MPSDGQLGRRMAPLRAQETSNRPRGASPCRASLPSGSLIFRQAPLNIMKSTLQNSHVHTLFAAAQFRAVPSGRRRGVLPQGAPWAHRPEHPHQPPGASSVQAGSGRGQRGGGSSRSSGPSTSLRCRCRCLHHCPHAGRMCGRWGGGSHLLSRCTWGMSTGICTSTPSVLPVLQ